MEDERLLRINLTTGSSRIEQIDHNFLKSCIGGKGLGTKYLLAELQPRIDPLGPKNKLFFICGPLTGSIFPTCNRFGLLFKSPLTGTYAESYSGGSVAKNLRASGFYMVIIEGMARSPVFIHISGENVTINNANHIWGMDCIETDEYFRSSLGPEVEIACIGPAGENLVRIASVQNNKYHSAGRCGPGAVMGSKRLKAIAFSGTRTPEINKYPEFRDVVQEALKRIKGNQILFGKDGMYRQFGTPIIVDWTNELGCFPTKYYNQGYSDYSELIGARALNKRILKERRGCWNCPFTCGKHVQVKEGPFTCEVDGPEYETIANFGGLCDIRDIRAIAKINEYCDRMGIDTISAGALCSLAIEAKNRGSIEELRATNLEYNNPLSVLAFLDDIVHLRGLGKDFAMGTRHVEQKFGLHDFAMHVKGLEFAGYDPRAFRGFALSYGVSPEGPTHLRSTYHVIERELPLSYENRVIPMIEQEDKMAILDSLIVCKFIREILDWDFLTNIYNILFEETKSVQDLRNIALIMITNSRIFNAREGFSRKDDYLPDRVYREPLQRKSGAPHVLDRDQYDRMLDEYYKARGWSRDGIPPTDT